MLLLIQLVITCWRSFIQMLIIQMAAQYSHNHIIMAFYIDCIHSWYLWTVSNYMLIISHTMLIIQIQAHYPQNTQTYMKTVEEEKKKKGLFVQKRSLSYAPIRWQVRHSGASRAVARGQARIQITIFRVSLTFFFLDGLMLFGTLPATKSCCFFYHQDAVFERNLFHNGHKQ